MGWWTWQRVDEIEMMEDDVFRQSIWRDAPLDGEALAAARALHGDGLDWWRFDYFDDDFRAALAVGWSASRDRVVVDHRLMPLLPPPVAAPGTEARLLVAPDAPIAYGAWCRIDDAAIEAFRIWPSARTVDDGPGRLTLHGGWFGGVWSDTLTRSAGTFPPDLMADPLCMRGPFAPTTDLRTPLERVCKRWGVVPRSAEPTADANDLVVGTDAETARIDRRRRDWFLLRIPKADMKVEFTTESGDSSSVMIKPGWRSPYLVASAEVKATMVLPFVDLMKSWHPRENSMWGLDYDAFHGLPERIPSPYASRLHRREAAAAAWAILEALAAEDAEGEAPAPSPRHVRLNNWHWIGPWLPHGVLFDVPEPLSDPMPPAFRDYDVIFAPKGM